MNRELALAKFLRKYGDNLTINDICIIKKALKKYVGEFDENNWEKEVFNIINLYVMRQEFFKSMKMYKTKK